MAETINPRLVELALSEVNGEGFERFFREFGAAVEGTSFTPLGGIKDGGADAFESVSIYEGDRVGNFFQASIQADTRAKVRETHAALKKAGRDIKVIWYYTAREIKMLDQLEMDLSDECGCHVRIRHRTWISNNINKSRHTQAAFENHLTGPIQFLKKFGTGQVTPSNWKMQANRTACVFLAQEVERRAGNAKLIDSVTDSLLLWALEGTDPATDSFLTRDNILSRIEEEVPFAIEIVRGTIDHRLKELRTKSGPSGREIRYYRKKDHYCLPYETRQLVYEENAEDAILHQSVIDIFDERASEHIGDQSFPFSSEEVARAAMEAIHLTFEKQGLELSAFLNSDQSSEPESLPSIAEQLDEVVVNFDSSYGIEFKNCIIAVIRHAFYSSRREERLLFSKLSRTYFFLLAISAEPKVIDYFQAMSSELELFVGSDIIIRALTEFYLEKEDQMTCNLLGMLKDAGANLIVTDLTIDEVWGHICGTDNEFNAEFSQIEPHVDWLIASQSRKILIRSYFYARLDPDPQAARPTGWRSYLGNFCTYQQIHSPAGRQELKLYVMERFGLEFLSEDELDRLTDNDDVTELGQKFSEIKESKMLAENDAKQVLAVYGRRSKLREYAKNNPLGFRTWWLTQEARILRATKSLVVKSGPFIMRPEFILNFIALAPETNSTASKFSEFIPSLLGIKLTNRMKPELLHDSLSRAKEFLGKDDARVRVEMGTLANKIKQSGPKDWDARLSSPFDD